MENRETRELLELWEKHPELHGAVLRMLRRAAEPDFSQLPQEEQERIIYVDLIERQLPGVSLPALRFTHSFLGTDGARNPHPGWQREGAAQ